VRPAQKALIQQLSFLDSLREATPDRGRLRAACEKLLAEFEVARRSTGAHPQSVRREVSQLRAISRGAGLPNKPVPLTELLIDPETVARVLREPDVPISRSTVRARLIAFQRFAKIMGPRIGSGALAAVSALDALLPAGRRTGWHTAGIAVGGSPNRRRRRGPTLTAADLRRIVDAAGENGEGNRVERDRALVALQCFCGLRPKEIVRLRWEDLSTQLTSAGYYGLTATVDRGGRRVRLPLPAPSAEAVEELARISGGTVGYLSGPVIRTREKLPRALSYRAARDIVRNACRRAGLPSLESSELRAACAHWLRSQGLSDHEVAAVLGVVKVRTVDRLLHRHAALDAQRAVGELLNL
jgi:integrase